MWAGWNTLHKQETKEMHKTYWPESKGKTQLGRSSRR